VIEVRLPWPPATLSSNTRQHWAALARARKSYRAACWAAALEQRANRHRVEGKVDLRVTFHPPAARHYDEDNLVARIKSGLDGLAQALGIDDHSFHLREITIGDARKGGMVDIAMGEDCCAVGGV